MRRSKFIYKMFFEHQISTLYPDTIALNGVFETRMLEGTVKIRVYTHTHTVQ